MAEKKKTGGRAASLANLDKGRVRINDRPPEEQREIRRKAREAQQQTMRKRKHIQEIAETALAMVCPDNAINLGDIQQAAMDAAKERGEPLDVYEVGYLVQVAKMLLGSTRAAEFVRDSAGDKPGDNLQVQADTMTAADTALLDKVAKRMRDKDGAPGE